FASLTAREKKKKVEDGVKRAGRRFGRVKDVCGWAYMRGTLSQMPVNNKEMRSLWLPLRCHRNKQTLHEVYDLNNGRDCCIFTVVCQCLEAADHLKKWKTTPTKPPENLIIEFPPKFDLHELGAKVRTAQGKNTRKPPNAFILFRKKYLDALHRLGQRIPMKNVSGWARDAWNLLPQHQKQAYEDIATKAASLYQEWAPHTPSRRTPLNRQTKKRDRQKKSTADEVESPTLFPPQEPIIDGTFYPELVYFNDQFNFNLYNLDWFNCITPEIDHTAEIYTYEPVVNFCLWAES
ncbi:18830_t:CDS:2, partial [Acaulospora morrowiae]